MRCLLDTNVPVSAALWPGATVSEAFDRAVTPPNEGIVCPQTLDEVREVFARKFPEKADVLARVVGAIAAHLEAVDVPAGTSAEEFPVRDPDDRAILRASLATGADVIITGDRDLLEAGVSNPLVVSPRAFLEVCASGS